MGTHHKGTEKETNSLNSFIKLVRTYESLSSRLYMLFEKENLTEIQFYLIDALYHLGSLNQKVISKKISRSEGNITMVVNNLEKRNLIKKKRNEVDKRVYNIELKKEGVKLYEKIFPIFLKAIMSEFSALTVKEHKEFQRFCKKIGLNKLNPILPKEKGY